MSLIYQNECLLYHTLKCRNIYQRISTIFANEAMHGEITKPSFVDEVKWTKHQMIQPIRIDDHLNKR